jgi:hypothetical protein
MALKVPCITVEARPICCHPHQMIQMQPSERREVMIEVREMIDTEVDAGDVRELIDTELDTVSGGSPHSRRPRRRV